MLPLNQNRGSFIYQARQEAAQALATPNEDETSVPEEVHVTQEQEEQQENDELQEPYAEGESEPSVVLPLRSSAACTGRRGLQRGDAYGAATSRAEAQVLRLSAIYAALDCNPLIDACHVEAALAVWDYRLASARLLFDTAPIDPTAQRISQPSTSPLKD